MSVYRETKELIELGDPFSKLIDMYSRHADLLQEEKDKLYEALRGYAGEISVSLSNYGLHISMDKEAIIEIAEAYLRRFFASEGGATADFKPGPISVAGLEVDGELILPNKNIYFKVENESSGAQEIDYHELLRRISPSEFWILSLSQEELELFSEPFFISENKVMLGRVMIVNLRRIFSEVLGLDDSSDIKVSSGKFRIYVKRPSIYRWS